MNQMGNPKFFKTSTGDIVCPEYRKASIQSLILLAVWIVILSLVLWFVAAKSPTIQDVQATHAAAVTMKNSTKIAQTATAQGVKAKEAAKTAIAEEAEVNAAHAASDPTTIAVKDPEKFQKAIYGYQCETLTENFGSGWNAVRYDIGSEFASEIGPFVYLRNDGSWTTNIMDYGALDGVKKGEQICFDPSRQ